jgi:hypothetical protein
MSNLVTLTSQWPTHRPTAHKCAAVAQLVLWLSLTALTGVGPAVAEPKPAATRPLESAPGRPAANTINPPVAQPASIWSSLLSLLRRQEPPLASRGRVCPILPGLVGETYTLWNRSPLFVWQGQGQRIEVRPYSLERSFDQQPILWQKALTPEMRQVTYSGPALQYGQKYDWQMVDVAGIPRRYTFAILPPKKHQAIDQQLTALLQRLPQATPEQRAVARAQFFAEQQLWSDAIQEVYIYQGTVNSGATMTTAEDVSNYFCTGT